MKHVVAFIARQLGRAPHDQPAKVDAMVAQQAIVANRVDQAAGIGFALPKICKAGLATQLWPAQASVNAAQMVARADKQAGSKLRVPKEAH